MLERHPSQEQLLAFRDGESADPRLREHLAGCPECQRAFDDSRWFMALARLKAAETPPAGNHLERDEIAGYMDHALSRSEQLVVERHLESCRRCTIVYRRLRDAQAEVAYSSPPVPLLERVKQQFTPNPGSRLGTLILLHVGKTLRWFFRPEEKDVAFDRISDLRALRAPPSAMPLSSHLSHPSSAKSRRRRLGIRESLDEMGQQDEALALPISECFAERESRELGEETIRVVAGEWLLTVCAGGPDRMRVHVAERHSGQPVDGVALSLIPERGPSANTETDPDGYADLPLLDGPAKLRIGHRTPWTLDLRHGPLRS